MRSRTRPERVKKNNQTIDTKNKSKSLTLTYDFFMKNPIKEKFYNTIKSFSINDKIENVKAHVILD